MPFSDTRLKTLGYVLLLIGICLISKAYSCTSYTTRYKRLGDIVTLQFHATITDLQNPTLLVTNDILSPYGSKLLTIAYRNGNHIVTTDCFGCAFTGDADKGDISISLDNLQATAAGTYKHTVKTSDNVLGCVTVYIIGIPKKSVITLDKDPSVGESVTLTCSSTSTTTPNNHNLSLTYNWRVENDLNPGGSRYAYSADRKTLTLSSVVKEDAKNQFTCSATEIITGGYTSDNSVSVSLNVLYSPDDPPNIEGHINGGKYTVLENDQGLLSCSIKGGNPQAKLSWTCYNAGSPAETVGNTVTKNVTWTATRKQDRSCICQSSHVIAGNQIVSVNIEILYRTSVTSFFVVEHRDQDIIVVDEYDSINFTCVVDSNPESTIKVISENNILKEVSNTKNLSFTLLNVACLHGGIYTCEGSNGYGQPSTKKIRLFVRCSPRPLQQIKDNATSTMYIPVTHSFTVLAYPEPEPTGYKWYKEVGTRWITLLSNSDLQISSSGLQSNLTVLNVSQTDYGQYRVTVENTLGTYEQFLFLTESKEHTSETATEETSSACTNNAQTSNTALIVGVTVGIVCIIAVVYAAVVTILLKRRTTNKDQKPADKPTSQTTYVNLGYKPNVTEGQVCTSSGNIGNQQENIDATDKQYTSLNPLTKDDKSVYDVVQTH